MTRKTAELLQWLENHERYLIRQLKTTDNKRYYYQIIEVHKIRKKVLTLEKER